jgi:hypothetical protein
MCDCTSCTLLHKCLHLPPRINGYPHPSLLSFGRIKKTAYVACFNGLQSGGKTTHGLHHLQLLVPALQPQYTFDIACITRS